jgi:hypothetical protein
MIRLSLFTMFLLAPSISAFAPTATSSSGLMKSGYASNGGDIRTNTHLYVLPCPIPSLLAGSIAGALGVGIAYPLDTIKTKSQIMATSKAPRIQQYASIVCYSSSGALIFPPPADNNNLLQVTEYIYKKEGLAGFYGGVRTSMAGQSIIKAVVFAVNTYMLELLREQNMFHDNLSVQLLFAAATAGFVTSFLAAPVDRIKVLMQANSSQYEGRDDQAVQAVLSSEGWKGLMGRGLSCTMLREIPAYTLYFSTYGSLQTLDMTDQLGAWAPLIYGAIAGCACWIPIYPIDVVKTVIQNTEGGSGQEERSLLQVAADLHQKHGLGVFWDGISPRLLRQAVNHAATFALYDTLLHDVFMKI